VSVAVLERVVVERLGKDARHAESGNVGGERACIRANVRVGRAEFCEVGVAEGVPGGAVGVADRERVVVEKDGPGVHLETPLFGCGAKFPEDVPLPGEGAHGRLDAQSLPAGPPPGEEERSALEKSNLPDGIVREDIPPVVIGGRQR
jgi:hypothetical protein